MYLEQVQSAIAANNASRNILSTFCKGEIMVTTEAGHKEETAQNKDLALLLEVLKTRKNVILNEEIDTRKEAVALSFVKSDWSPVVTKVHVMDAYNNGHISKNEMVAQQSLAGRLMSSAIKLKSALDDIESAIDFLAEYLDPSPAGVSLSNNWSHIATTAPGKDYMRMFDDMLYENAGTIYESVIDILNTGETNVQTVINEINTMPLKPDMLFDVFQYSAIDPLPSGLLEWLDSITQEDTADFRAVRDLMTNYFKELI